METAMSRTTVLRIVMPTLAAVAAACGVCAVFDTATVSSYGLIGASLVFPSVVLLTIIDARRYGWPAMSAAFALPAVLVLGYCGLCVDNGTTIKIWGRPGQVLEVAFYFLQSYGLALLAAFACCVVQRWRGKPLQFTIRGLLLLVAGVCCALAWLNCEMRKADERIDAINTIIEHGGEVIPMWPSDGSGVYRFVIYSREDLQPTPHHRSLQLKDNGIWPNWEKLRIDVQSVVFGGRDFTDAEFSQVADDIRKLKRLRNLTLTNTSLTDDSLRTVAECRRVLFLSLTASDKITDRGVAHLADMSSLVHLRLDGTAVTDRTLRNLPPNLQALNLSSSFVTDEGLRKMRGCESLQELELMNLEITLDGVMSLADGRFPQLHSIVVDDSLTAEEAATARKEKGMRVRVRYENRPSICRYPPRPDMRD